jgi:chromosome segregation ATPase
MIRRNSPLLAALFALGAILLASSPGYSADWDRFPPLEPREHVALKKRFDGPKYDDLRTCYRRFDSRVGADYYAAMVDVTAESGSRSRKESDARGFAKALYGAWQDEGRLDGEDDILVVLGLRNRSIAIHPGAKWKKIGFDGEVIDNTIDASHFEKHRSRRNYVEALCSLATAVDLRLASLEQEMSRRIAALQQRLPELDEKLTGLHKKVAARFEEHANDDHPFGKELLGKLAAARTKLDDAKSLLEDKPKEAVHLADQVEAVLQPVRANLETFNEDMNRLDEVEEELAALKTTIEQREDLASEEPQAALLQVAKCEQKAKEIRQDYEGTPWQVRDCQRAAEVHLGKADIHGFYLRTVLPAIAIALLVLLLIGFLVLRTLRRRRALRQLEPDLAEWRRRLDDASQHIYELELACPSYFASGRTPWQGDSQDIDQRVAGATDRMSQLLAEGRNVLARAEALHKKSHLLDARRLEAALGVLRESQVTLAEAYGGNASTLLGDLDAAHRQALEHLDEVVETSTRLTEQSSQAADAVSLATAAVDERGELGLPTEHLSEPLEKALDAWKRATRLADHDPVRAAQIFGQAYAQLDEVAQRAASGNEVVQRVQGPLGEMGETLNQKIRQLQFARVDLDKLRFEPQQELDASKRDAARIVDLVNRAREDQACEAVAALQVRMDRLADRLEVVADASEHAPQRIAELTERGKELKERLMQTSYALKSLPAKEAYSEESKKVGRYQSHINRLSKQLSQAKRNHAAKHYLTSSEQLDDIAALLDDAEALLTELGEVEQSVEHARAESGELYAACEPMVQDLQARAKQPGVCRTLRTLMSEQFVSLQMIGDQMEADQANWLEARRELQSVRKVIDFLEVEINADLETYAQASSLAKRLQDDLSSLAQPSTDSAQVVTHANEMLAGWSAQLDEGSSGGLTLLRTGHEVAKAVARATKAASTPLALSVASQHAYALSRYDEVHASAYGYDVFGDCSHVAAELDEATAAVDAGDRATALALLEAAIEQIELEDARADAAAQREYRKAQAKNMIHDAASNGREGPAMLGKRSSWANAVSTLGEPSGAMS